MGSILLIHSIVLSRQRNSTHTMCLCAVLSGWVKSKASSINRKLLYTVHLKMWEALRRFKLHWVKSDYRCEKVRKSLRIAGLLMLGSVLFFLTVDHPPKCSLRHLAEVGITLKSCAKVILFLLLFQFRAWSLFHLLFWVVRSGAGEHILGWLLAYRKFNA